MSSASETTPLGRVVPYLRMARPDHWFKNAFMLLGVLLAAFYQPSAVTPGAWPLVVAGVLATCLVASSNYVINELLDAARDRHHPIKRARPAAAGHVRPSVALGLWLALGAAGIGLGLAINRWFALWAAALWVMGCVYNIPPVRTKELPYADVLSEAVNNPLRLLLGWYALGLTLLPPVSLLLAYWLGGAFFMAMKRYAELASIGDRELAARYRSSFAHYTPERLLVSVMFYATASALFSGIFIVRYKLELILCVPLVAGFFAYYLKLGLEPDSPVQSPERLHRRRTFFAYGLLVLALGALLMFADIPALYELFNVEPAGLEPLWHFG